MQVKFLKDFMQYKTGEVAEATPERAAYWGLMKVAEEFTGKPAKASGKAVEPMLNEVEAKPKKKK